MISQSEPRSILTVDVGSCRTKAALYEIVEGRYRFVARADVLTTLYWPVEDVSVGVRQAIEKIESISGRTMLSSNAPIVGEVQDGTGVDVFATTTSAGGGLRLFVITPSVGNPLFSQLKIAAELAPVDVAAFALDGRDRTAETRLEALAKALLRFDPHAIFIVAQPGNQASTAGLGRDILEAISSLGCEGIPVRFLGEQVAADAVAQEVRDKLDFRAVVTGAAVNSEDLLALQRELVQLWEQNAVTEVPGYPLVISWQNAPVESTFFAFGNAVRFLSGYHKTDVLAVDVGASSVGLFRVSTEDGHAKSSSMYGVGRAAIGLLNPDAESSAQAASFGEASIRRWLATDLPVEDVGDLILNKWARPWTVPETDQEMLFERGLAIESVQRLRSDLKGQQYFFRYQENLGIVIGAGSVIGNQTSAGRMALTLLDALEPAGVFAMAVDCDSLVASLGAAGRTYPQAAAEVLLGDAWLELGTCLACVPGGRPGSKAADVEITRSGRSETIEVPAGEIRVIPLPSGETAEVAVSPVRGLDFGWGKGRSGKVTVKGGALGLIIDTRGRPLTISEDDGHIQQVRGWLDSVDLREVKQ